ncbi:MAG: type II/IV secretion system protein [Elusimicrobiota bacterium]|jgi:type IV pilus assembly protein PilB
MGHRFKDEWILRAALAVPGVKPEMVESLRAGSKSWLSRALLESKLASPQSLRKAVQEVYGIESAEPAAADLDKMALSLVPEKVCRAKRVLPFCVRGERLDLLMENPLDTEALQDAQAVSGRVPHPLYVLSERLDLLMDAAFSREAMVFDLLKRIEEDERVEVLRGDRETPAQDDEGAEEGVRAPVIKLVNSIVVKAVRMGASDIHIEHEEGSSAVRLRVDGVLKNILMLPRYLASGPVVSRIKIMSGLDVAEHHKPQDGRAKLRVGGESIDLRVSTLPTSFGEKVVIRVLDPRGAKASFDNLGLRPELAHKLQELLKSPQGILLVTGPTGSGKTTTLYCALNFLKSPDTNIVTVEDPVEYRLPGVNQVQVNDKQGMSFASILRSVLRQDPDIILVGEIRDHETADTALQASMTGHLVLSTLHTNDAVGALTRLGDMGAERFKIASGLLGVLAQRLVRRLCPECREKLDPAALPDVVLSEMKRLGIKPASWGPRGCMKCDFQGYKGRLPIIELLEVDAALRARISAGDDENAIRENGLASRALQPLTQDAVWRVSTGETSIVEVLPYLDARSSVPVLKAQASLAAQTAVSPVAQVPAVPVARAPVVPAAQVPAGPKGRRRVLVADDDTVVRVLMRQILSKEGFEVEEACDGAQALEKLAARPPDLLLCDLNMPKVDGWGVIRGVREKLGQAALPIVVMTAEADDRSQELALKLGADDYIVKPSRPVLVLARIQGLFRRLGVATK